MQRDWLEAIEATNKLKDERMKVLNHDKLKEWTLGCMTRSPCFSHRSTSLAKHAKLVPLCFGLSSVLSLFFLSFSTASRSMPNMCGVGNSLSVSAEVMRLTVKHDYERMLKTLRFGFGVWALPTLAFACCFAFSDPETRDSGRLAKLRNSQVRL